HAPDDGARGIPAPPNEPKAQLDELVGRRRRPARRRAQRRERLCGGVEAELSRGPPLRLPCGGEARFSFRVNVACVEAEGRVLEHRRAVEALAARKGVEPERL